MYSIKGRFDPTSVMMYFSFDVLCRTVKKETRDWEKKKNQWTFVSLSFSLLDDATVVYFFLDDCTVPTSLVFFVLRSYYTMSSAPNNITVLLFFFLLSIYRIFTHCFALSIWNPLLYSDVNKSHLYSLSTLSSAS